MMTPPARWRPHGLPHSAFILGPATCQCGALVWFGRANTRVEGITVVGEVRTWREWGRYAAHRCEIVKAQRPDSNAVRKPHPMLANARAAWEAR